MMVAVNHADAIRLLKSGKPGEKQQALCYLVEHATADAAPALVSALRDPDPKVAEAAAAALWSLWHRSGEPETDRLLMEGMTCMENRVWDDALAHFDQVIQRNPLFAEGYNKRATVYYLMGEYRKSVEDCQRTLALNPHHFGALSGEGLCHVALGELPRALRCFQQALAVHPHMSAARRNIALVLRAMGFGEN